MAKRKKTSKKRTSKKKASWAKIGNDIGSKIDKECPEGQCVTMNKTWMCHANEGKGFVGRVLFAIFGLIALGQAGLLDGISTWVLVFVGIGFALMRL